MQRYKAVIEYDGTNYYGMQKQKTESNTVQEVVEKAISKFANRKIQICFSGRTDSGVHALGQVIHFDLYEDRNEYKVLHGINFYLIGKSVVVKQVFKVDNAFHARFSAKRRKYLYRVLISDFASPLLKNRVFVYKYDLDLDKMHKCVQLFVGKKMDFSAFCSAESLAKINPYRTINSIKVEKVGEEVRFLFEAKSFLHNMIRIMVGVLLNVGRGKISLEEVERILRGKKRPDNCNTAPACGLYFLETEY